MKVLFIDFTIPYLLADSEYPVGGWAVELSSWLAGLKAAGHRSGVMSWKGAAAYASGNTLCDLLDTYDPDRGIKGLKYFYDYLPSMMSVAAHYKPDVIVQSCANIQTGLMAFIAQRLGVPFVNRVASDLEADARWRSLVPQTYQRLAYDYGMKRADAVLCQNRYQVAQFEQRLPSAPVHLIHNPFSIPKQLAGAMPREDRRYVAWLAVFRDGKNLPLLARLAQRLPHIRFRVGGMPEKRMSAAVGEAMVVLQSLPNVEMVGYVRRQDVMAFLSNAVALLSTSDFEGFSNTFLEAFATGTPLVLRRQIDPDAIVAEKGLGFSARDEDDLAVALDRIWSMERSDFHEVSARCAAYVREEHDPQAKVEQLMTVLAPLGVA